MLARGIGREVQCIWTVPETQTGDDPEIPSGLALGDRFVDLAADLASAPLGEPVPIHRDEPAIWLFTSGSTGEPKANIHSHRDFAFNTEVYAKRTLGYRKDDVTISVPRLFFGYATGTNLLFPFAVGATAALFSERPTPETVAAAIDMYRPTVVTNVPTMIGKLLEHDQALRARGEPRARSLQVRSLFALRRRGVARAAPPPLARTLQERCLRRDRLGRDVSHLRFEPPWRREAGLSRQDGRRLRAARVLPEEAEGPGAAPCPAGEIGVLWVRGDSVSEGYWLDRDKSWKTFHGHWCRTGDLFRMDGDGYLYFAGRARRAPEGERSLGRPRRGRGVPDESPRRGARGGHRRGGRRAAEAEGVHRAARRGRARSRGAGDGAPGVGEGAARRSTKKYPRLIEFVTDVPKNDRGKVDRRALRAREEVVRTLRSGEASAANDASRASKPR